MSVRKHHFTASKSMAFWFRLHWGRSCYVKKQ